MKKYLLVLIGICVLFCGGCVSVGSKTVPEQSTEEKEYTESESSQVEEAEADESAEPEREEPEELNVVFLTDDDMYDGYIKYYDTILQVGMTEAETDAIIADSEIIEIKKDSETGKKTYVCKDDGSEAESCVFNEQGELTDVRPPFVDGCYYEERVAYAGLSYKIKAEEITSFEEAITYLEDRGYKCEKTITLDEAYKLRSFHFNYKTSDNPYEYFSTKDKKSYFMIEDTKSDIIGIGINAILNDYPDYYVSMIFCFSDGYYFEETSGEYIEDMFSLSNDEKRQLFAEYFSQDEIKIVRSVYRDETPIYFWDRNLVQYKYLDMHDPDGWIVPTLFIYEPGAVHYIGEYQIWLVDEETGMPEYKSGLDMIKAVYPQDGIALSCHWGGGYGETRTYYMKLQNNDMEVIGETYIMDDESFAQLYVERFGEPYKDIYIIGNYKDGKEVTKEEFEQWFEEQIRNSECIENIEYAPINGMSEELVYENFR